MILGHLPAGYVVAKRLHRRFADSSVSWRALLLASLLGAVAPDFDFLYYYTFGQQRYHHHAYVTHYPLFWGALLLGAIVSHRLARDRLWASLGVVFTFNAFIHLCLDSFAGSIRWLAPFAYEPYSLLIVPHMTGSRRLDYLQHWSFWLELMPISWALWLYWRERQRH
ncbi:MAG: hypothetical protein H6R01_1273 [Burkholderiaceae bacterium]|nr:hypothetical protein [Burkholderiaceae bacterium]